MLTVAGVNKHYETPSGPVSILRDVNFSLGTGESAAIMGPSGSGKSTLLYILGALEPPSTGTVTVDAVDPFTLDERALASFRNREIGFVFQDHCLLPQLSVLENVLIPTLVADERSGSSKEAAVLARTLIGEVGLAHRIDHHPAALSGGERQRVAIARALIRRPRIMLCDEPTGNLDAEAANVVVSLLLDLHERHDTVLIVVTHSASVASRFPARFELSHGSLQQVTG